MSVQHALIFIRELRKQLEINPEKRQQMLTLGLEDMAHAARQQSLDFSVDDLRQAHLIDWKMRSARFSIQK